MTTLLSAKRLHTNITLLAFVFSVSFVHGQTVDSPFTVENYYKVKWGYADEFISLWKKNHYPLLQKAQEKGDIVEIVAEKPRLHSGEDTRWDFKVTITFKNSQLAFDENLTIPYKKKLYPDIDKLNRDEQHRFDLLLAHWDVITEKVDLTKLGIQEHKNQIHTNHLQHRSL